MSNQEILEKAIQKAIDGGWRNRISDNHHWNDTQQCWIEYYEEAVPVREVILDHDFAKALWGEEWIEEFPFASEGSYKYSERQQAWKKHLQQMVIAPDPIKYLGENI